VNRRGLEWGDLGPIRTSLRLSDFPSRLPHLHVDADGVTRGRSRGAYGGFQAAGSAASLLLRSLTVVTVATTTGLVASVAWLAPAARAAVPGCPTGGHDVTASQASTLPSLVKSS